MAAIITDDFRRNSTTFLLNDIIDQNTGAGESVTNGGTFEYFIGIGKTDPWPNDNNNNPESSQNFSVPLPTGSEIEAKEVIDNLAGAVAIEANNAYHVIPRVNWSINRRYKRWNENDPTMFDVSTVGGVTYFPCYVVAGAAGSEKIYVCLDNDSNNSYGNDQTYVPSLSQIQPTGGSSTPTSSPTVGDRNIEIFSDGYIWAYVADINNSSNFNTDQFVSVSYTADGLATDATTASGGIVYGFEIISGGLNISSSDFKLLLNKKDGTARQVDLTVDNSGPNGSAKGVVMTGGMTLSDILDTKTCVRASVVPGPSTTATTLPVIRPLVAPELGFGYSPAADLPSFYAGLTVNYNGDVEGELSTNINYRQISLLRNPTRNDDDDPAPTGDGDYAEAEVYNTLRRIELTSSVDLSSVTQGTIIEDVSTPSGSALTVTGAKAFIDYVDNVNNHIYFHQNESPNINQQAFTAGGANAKISIAGGSALAYSAISTPEYTPYTGEVYFLENRKPIQRATSQEEEIKLVIQF